MATKKIVMPELNRGYAIAYDLLKGGKSFSRKAIRALGKQKKISNLLGMVYRLGRKLRDAGVGDVVADYTKADKGIDGMYKLVMGAAAKAHIAEKAKKYANLTGPTGDKKSKKSSSKKVGAVSKKAKVAAKKAVKATAKKIVAKVAAKKASPKQVAAKKAAAKKYAEEAAKKTTLKLVAKKKAVPAGKASSEEEVDDMYA